MPEFPSAWEPEQAGKACCRLVALVCSCPHWLDPCAALWPPVSPAAPVPPLSHHAGVYSPKQVNADKVSYLAVGNV